MNENEKQFKMGIEKGKPGGVASHKQPIKTLLIDNYDSYTYNLYQLIARVNGVAPCVVYNDAYNTNLLDLSRGLGKFDNVVLSPGPGRPDRASDFGLCSQILQCCDIPTLGVCLGHQGIGHFSGGKVIHAPEAMHGRYSRVYHDNKDVFHKIPQGFSVVRYHSLTICPSSLPPCLSPSAWTFGPDGNGIIMGVTHKAKPQWGVQFHPESIGTEYGHQLIENFNALTREWKEKEGIPYYSADRSSSPTEALQNPSALEALESASAPTPVFFTQTDSTNSKLFLDEPTPKDLPSKPHQVVAVKLGLNKDSCPAVETLFEAFYGNCTTSFWLDSCGDLRPPEQKTSAPQRGRRQASHNKGRFSFMGSYDGEFGKGKLGALIEYFGNGQLKITDSSGETEVLTKSLFAYLKDITRSWQSQFQSYFLDEKADIVSNGKPPPKAQLPFDFKGGLVGFFGYEMRHDATEILASVSGDRWNPDFEAFSRKAGAEDNVPEAFFIFADRFLVYDHKEHEIFLVAVEEGLDGKVKGETQHWFAAAEEKIEMLASEKLQVSKQNEPDSEKLKKRFEESIMVPDESRGEGKKKWCSSRPRSRYLENVLKAKQLIKEGETYEVCLTNQLVRMHDRSIPPLDLYTKLRKSNPAHYAGFLKHDPQKRLVLNPSIQNQQENAIAFAVLCSSPERFLRIDGDKVVESQPIKGTAKRGINNFDDQVIITELRNSEKNQAENLMIVDLVRNDLGRVCEVGSVSVPRLMHVETYATVHQMVSTIQGDLSSDCNVVDAIVASFPGGSMTGAPKLRTMEVIDELEESYPRGVYSGSLGFLSIDGAANLNIVIRTAVMTPSTISVGAGGAIIALSDTDGEYEEMLLKSDSVVVPLTNALEMKGKRKGTILDDSVSFGKSEKSSSDFEKVYEDSIQNDSAGSEQGFFPKHSSRQQSEESALELMMHSVNSTKCDI